MIRIIKENKKIGYMKKIYMKGERKYIRRYKTNEIDKKNNKQTVRIPSNKE